MRSTQSETSAAEHTCWKSVEMVKLTGAWSLFERVEGKALKYCATDSLIRSQDCVIRRVPRPRLSFLESRDGDSKASQYRYAHTRTLSSIKTCKLLVVHDCFLANASHVAKQLAALEQNCTLDNLFLAQTLVQSSVAKL